MANPPSSLPPSKIKVNEYYSEYLEDLKLKNCIIFSALFSPDGRYLLACSSLGMVYCWDVLGDDNNKKCFSGEYWKNRISDENVSPIIRMKVMEGKIYHLNFFNSSNSSDASDSFLAVSGEKGIYLYRWLEIKHKMNDTVDHHSDIMNNKKPQLSVPSLLLDKPLSKFTPCTSSEYNRNGGVEVNCCSFDSCNNYLYGAAGDILGCYQWDLVSGSLLRTMNSTSDNRDYLHVVKVIEEGKVLTAGEDGLMNLWDGKEGKVIDIVNIKNIILKNQVTPSLFSYLSNAHFWVSDLDIEPNNANNWVAFCGGIEPTHQRRINNDKTTKNGGFMAIWNLPTRTITSVDITNETPHSIMYHSPFDRIVTIGNESIVSYWHWNQAKRTERASCISSHTKLQSGYALAIHPKYSALVAGGISSSSTGRPNLSCFLDLGSPSFSFST